MSKSKKPDVAEMGGMVQGSVSTAPAEFVEAPAQAGAMPTPESVIAYQAERMAQLERENAELRAMRDAQLASQPAPDDRPTGAGDWWVKHELTGAFKAKGVSTPEEAFEQFWQARYGSNQNRAYKQRIKGECRIDRIVKPKMAPEPAAA